MENEKRDKLGEEERMKENVMEREQLEEMWRELEQKIKNERDKLREWEEERMKDEARKELEESWRIEREKMDSEKKQKRPGAERNERTTVNLGGGNEKMLGR